MGSYCSLYVGNIEVGSTKNAIDPSVMLLFRAADRVEATLVPGTPEYARYYRMPGPDDKWVAEVHQRVCYETSARIVRERLDLLGFSFEASSRAFEVAVERELAYVRRRALEEHGSLWKDDLERLENFNLAVWRDGMSQIVAHDLWAVDQHSSEFAALSPLLRRMLSRDYEQWMGCPVRDVRHVIGLLLSVVEADETVYYDLTDLVAGGWVDDEADLVDYSEKLLRTGAAGSERVIVLTEGSTDKFILENSLMLLFPHPEWEAALDSGGLRIVGGMPRANRASSNFPITCSLSLRCSCPTSAPLRQSRIHSFGRGFVPPLRVRRAGTLLSRSEEFEQSRRSDEAARFVRELCQRDVWPITVPSRPRGLGPTE
jgi:hypothetical protein